MSPTRPAEALLLGLDVGTSAVKAGLFTPDGEAAHTHRIPVRVCSPQAGHSELDAEHIWDAVVAAARTVLSAADARTVAAVGVAAAAPTPLLVDRDGRPVSPVCTFADARAAGDVADRATRTDTGAYQRLTGNPVAVPTCSALTGASLAAAADAQVRFGHIGSLIVHRLTGRWTMDPTNAAYTGCLSISDPFEWSAEAVAWLGMDELNLPELVPSAETIGRLTPHAMEALGVADSVPVVGGCADTAAAALAVSCVEAGDTFESVGTSGVLTVCRDRPMRAMHAMNRPHVVPDRWLSHGAMSSSGAAVAWLRERVFRHADSARTLEQVSELAGSAPPGCGGVIFLPYLAGERSPVWDPSARGAWVGMSLETTTAELTRAVFEGAAYGLRQLLELERSLTGTAPADLLSVGGGTGSTFWSSLKADITDRTIHRATMQDVPARGAALLAACACGIYGGPLEAARAAGQIPTERFEPSARVPVQQIYDRMYGVYTDLYPALRPIFDSLRAVGEPQATASGHTRRLTAAIRNREGDDHVEHS